MAWGSKLEQDRCLHDVNGMERVCWNTELGKATLK